MLQVLLAHFFPKLLRNPLNCVGCVGTWVACSSKYLAWVNKFLAWVETLTWVGVGPKFGVGLKFGMCLKLKWVRICMHELEFFFSFFID